MRSVLGRHHQAPFRAGIKIDAYQMEPLRKALLLPRVNLFIADDTGLGKTIEAGLIVRELLLRRKVRTIVVAAPPSVLEQWKGEMEERFGLIFQMLDRHYLARVRRERGFGTNPWSAHSRFLVSHRLLADPTYADPMRAWLGAKRPGSLLVLDEAHHAAPSHRGRYGIESKFTRAVRDLCDRFEHRLFLSATPHNGHSNSFSTLLELLDPHRFTRGVKVRGKKDLDAVMVRRLKEDIREEEGGFPIRRVEPVVIDGLTGGPRRKEIQRRFKEPPAKDPLRILLATDAAREGLNFQAHCTDLFHFDLPWKPGRIEQRNGRIDRKLQPAEEVRCHYFKLPQRHEDRVLEVLVRKTGTMRCELGSLAKVIDEDVEARLTGGIRLSDAHALAAELQALGKNDIPADRTSAITEEFEAVRDRRRDLRKQIDRCRTLLDKSRNWVRFRPDAFRKALSCSLGIQQAGPLRRERDESGREVWRFPELGGRVAADPSWAATLDTLRVPIKREQKPLEWRKEAPIRPVVFSDPEELTEEVVHLHLEQRVAQRLLARFRAQGFIHNDLPRACLAHVADSVPRVVLLGRLSLYGERAERLHEEIVTVTARWRDPDLRRGPLSPYALEAERKTMALLDELLASGRASQPNETVRRRLLASAARDIGELRPQLEPRADALAERAALKLRERGAREAKELRETLVRQRDRVKAELDRHEAEVAQLALDLDAADKRQLEANNRVWRERLHQFERDLKDEPERIRSFYRVRGRPRVEPVGLVYLWPETG